MKQVITMDYYMLRISQSKLNLILQNVVVILGIVVIDIPFIWIQFIISRTSLSLKAWNESDTEVLSSKSNERNVSNLHSIICFRTTFWWIGLYTDTPCNSCKFDKESAACIACQRNWYWLDGEPFEFYKWGGEDPNNKGRCALLWTRMDGFGDLGCSYQYHFICKAKG